MSRISKLSFVFCACLTSAWSEKIAVPVYKLEDKSIELQYPKQNKFIDVIEKEDLEYFSTLEEALKQVNGLNVRKISGLGSYSQLSFRGSSSEQINIYLDDVKLNSAGQTSVDVSKIPLKIIEKVIVDKNGMISGPGGNTGVTSIYLITRKMGLQSGSVTGRTGSFSRNELSGHYKGKYKRLNYQVNSSFQKARNNFPYESDNGTEFNKTDDTIRLRTNNQFQNFHLGGVFDYYFTNPGVISFIYKHFDYNKHYPGIYTDSGSTYTEYQDNIFSGKYLFTPESDVVNKFKLYGETRVSKDNYTDPEEKIGWREYQLARNTSSYSAGMMLEVSPQKRISLLPQFRFKIEKAEAIDVNGFIPEPAAPPDADLTESTSSLKTIFNLPGRAEVQMDITIPWLIFNSSKKQDTFSEELKFRKTFREPSMSATTVWAPDANDQFLLKLARQYRFPGFSEILGNNNNFRKNMNLSPELIYTNSFSYKKNILNALVESTLYFNYYNDPIRFRVMLPYYQYVNSESYRYYGLELGIQKRFSHLYLQNKFDISDARVEHYDIDIKGNRPAYHHRYIDHFIMEYQLLRGFSVSSSAEYRSSYFISEKNIPTQKRNSITVIGHGLNWTGGRYRWSFLIENVTDELHEDFHYNPNSGRSYTTTLTINL